MWFGGVLIIVATAYATLYDSFSGEPATKSQIRRYSAFNTTFYCITDVQPCDPDEYRRIDGTCNNLKNPQRGAIHTPSFRVLPQVYGEGYTNRKTKDNKELKNPRYIRTQALLTGKASSTKFTQLILYVLVFMAIDVASLEDTQSVLADRSYCCEPRGKLDDMCAPVLIPYNDPVHRYSQIRCMNSTRPYTFQYYKCLSNDTIPERIMPSTPLFDLSQVYDFASGINDKLREFSGGRMVSEIVNGNEYQPSSTTGNFMACLSNRQPKETHCHLYHSNGVLGSNMVSTWVYRLHNFIATKLSNLNPSWNDEKLFYTARDITIAFILQIFFYELLPALLGRKNLMKDGVISGSKGYRDIYDENIIPQMSDEFNYVMRYFHITQENSIHMYDKKGNFVRSFPMVNLTGRTGYLVENDHEGQIIRGSYKQRTGASFDYAADPGLTETGLGDEQLVFDIPTTDLVKGRLLGIAPYKDYREFCTKNKYTKWEDFYDAISPERIYRLRTIYKDIEDLELITGVWSEGPVEGGDVPPTVYCLMVEQLIRSIKSDRHWYERKNRPHAFTYEQLLEIRNANMAYLLCTVTNDVDKIQPRPFETCNPKNEYVTCDKIKKMDLSPWKEN